MQRPLDPGAVVVAELPDALRDIVEVFARDFGVVEGNLVALEARLRQPTQVQ